MNFNLLYITLSLISTIQSKTQVYDIENTKPLNIVLHSSLGGRSHIKAMLEIGEELIKRGHKLTYAATEDNIPFTKGYTIGNYSIASSFINYDLVKEIMSNYVIEEADINKVKAKAKSFANIFARNYENTYLPLKQYLIKAKPDLLVCDFGAHACLDLAKQLSIPLITGLQTTDIFGILSMPYITEGLEYMPITTKDMSFYQRFYYKVIIPVINTLYMVNVFNKNNQVRRKYNVLGPSNYFGDPNYSLFIANTFIGFEPAISPHPNLFQLGPIVSQNRDKLSTELNNFLNNNERTLFIAFGSNVMLDKVVIKKILEAVLHALNENIIDGVIWSLGRTNQNDFPVEVNDGKGGSIKVGDLFNNFHPNIKLLNWAPQVSILDHKNTKLFLSHGGLESSFEAIYSGTPILCLAIFADQLRNARKLEDNGVGVYVNKFVFTSESLNQQIKLILDDKLNTIEYNLNRMKAITHYNSKRLSLAADLFEQHAYIAKVCRKFEPYDINSNLPPCELKHLIPVSNFMPFIKANNIDIYGAAILLLLFSSFATVIVLYWSAKISFSVYHSVNRLFNQLKPKVE